MRIISLFSQLRVSSSLLLDEKSGVDMMVAGSAILKEPRTVESYKETIDAMRAELAAVSK